MRHGLAHDKLVRMKYGVLGFLGLLGCGVSTVFYEPDPPSPSGTTVQPVFNGETHQSPTAPPPVTGGSVRIVKADNAAYAIVSDPEEDVIDVVSLDGAPALVGQIALSPGDEPNRAVSDASGMVHVVLRGGGAIATIDPRTASLVDRRAVCPAPRGIDYDASLDTLHVACATGELVSLGSTGPVTRVVRLDRDLRDVIVSKNGLLVTRFRSAEVLHVDSAGNIATRTSPHPSLDQTYSSMASVVAWRTIQNVKGDVVMLHQLASTQALVVVAWQTYYADANSPISASAVSVESGNDDPTALGIEVAIDATSDATGVVETLGLLGDIQTGNTNPNDPSASVISLGEKSTDFSVVNNHDQFVAIDDGGPIGVPFKVVQRRAPTAKLEIFGASFQDPIASVSLNQKTSHLDTGFDVFHIPTFVGTACMSCHPEGGDDGHTWKFSFSSTSGTGTLSPTNTEVRRTQSLRGGIVTDSAPYHWNGDLPTLGALCDEVFTHRMGGGKVTSTQEPIVAHWMNSIPRVPVRTDLDATKVAAGKALFEGSAGCTSCHVGGTGTLVANQDIGKTDSLGQSQPMQVPSLLDVVDRAPYMHDGCAATLMDRFTNPSCGGANHGNAANLSQDDLQSITTYLESL
jgi:hypothetical protein